MVAKNENNRLFSSAYTQVPPNPRSRLHVASRRLNGAVYPPLHSPAPRGASENPPLELFAHGA